MVAIPTFLFHIVLDVGIIGRLAVKSVRNGGILSFIYRLSFRQSKPLKYVRTYPAYYHP